MRLAWDYWKAVLVETIKGPKLWDMVIGFALAFMVLLMQLHYGIISKAQFAASAWSIVWPYALILAILVVFGVLHSTLRIYRAQAARLATLQSDLALARTREEICAGRASWLETRLIDDRLKNRPEMLLSLTADETLSIKNVGNSTAYSVALDAPRPIRDQRLVLIDSCPETIERGERHYLRIEVMREEEIGHQYRGEVLQFLESHFLREPFRIVFRDPRDTIFEEIFQPVSMGAFRKTATRVLNRAYILEENQI